MEKANIPHPTAEPVTTPGPDCDAIINRLKSEFLEFANEALDRLDGLLQADPARDGAHGDTVAAIRQISHDLKGTGTSFGFPLITCLASLMEAYFKGRPLFDQQARSDAQCFIHHMRQALAGQFDGVSETQVIQNLPTGSARRKLETVN